MVPAILALLVTLIGLFLSAMNLVREKELGTIEQINVTPIKKYQFIAGKLIPFWLLGLAELAFGLTIGKLLFNIPMLGSIPLLFAIAGIYLMVVLSLGLFISTLTHTQQQAMFVAFFVALICIMLSGIFTSTESMPQWAQWLNHLNPIYYFMRIVRMLLLKGSGFMDMISEILSLLAYAIIMLTLAVKKYKKVAA
jgi:ABC-2 type transport system permease protein